MKIALLTFLEGFSACSSVPRSQIVSGIDSQFKLERQAQRQWQPQVQPDDEGGGSSSTAVSFYQSVLSQTLGSQCSLHPNDSKYAQMNFKQCGAWRPILKSMSRYYLEPDASLLGLPVTSLDGRVQFIDIPDDCAL